MSIFQFACSPNRIRVFTYIGAAAIYVREQSWTEILRRCLGSDILGRIRMIACDWPRTEYGIGKADVDTSTMKRYPLLVYCRGGIGRVGRVRREWIQDFVSRGFIVVAPCYRASEGGEGTDEFGGCENDDVVSLVSGLATLPFVDPTRITLLGFSRGSINAWQTAIRLSTTVHSVIVWGGVSDLSSTYRERMNMRRMLRRITGGSPKEVPEAYNRRSPVHLVSQVNCPVLIVHGISDSQVHISHALRLADRLRSAEKPVTTHFYQGMGHHLSHSIHQAVVDRMCDWVRGIE